MILIFGGLQFEHHEDQTWSPMLSFPSVCDEGIPGPLDTDFEFFLGLRDLTTLIQEKNALIVCAWCVESGDETFPSQEAVFLFVAFDKPFLNWH